MSTAWQCLVAASRYRPHPASIPSISFQIPSRRLPDQIQSVHLAGTTQITLSAPTSGDYKDVLFYQDANSDPDLIAVFNGGADLELNGVLYFPNNPVRFSGNGDPGGATSIVARTVAFTGNANLGSNPGTKTFGPNGSNISLVH